MRILLTHPIPLRYQRLGALEYDEIESVRILRRLGHTVHLLTGVSRYHQPAEAHAFYGEHCPAIPLTVAAAFPRGGLAQRLIRPALWDGAAWDHAIPPFRAAFRQAVEAFRPDLVWAHSSFLWPVAEWAKQRGLRTVVRSINFEPVHYLQESGRSAVNLIRYWAKVRGEANAVRYADAFAAISPAEVPYYVRLNPRKNIHLLPLLSLTLLLRAPRPVREVTPLHAFFMGASYNIPHNRAALAFLVEQVWPRLRAASPGAYVLHILGSKAPPELAAQAAPDLIFEGYVPDLETTLAGMDVAIVPSLWGMGMQQKVFEPLCRAFPMVTHRRALAGYPLTDGEAALIADDADSFVQALMRLRAAELRAQLSAGAAAWSAGLFSNLDQAVQALLEAAGKG